LAVSSSIIVPWVETMYSLMDRAKGLGAVPGAGVPGRNIGFSSVRNPADEDYPSVVSITWDVERQQTELALSDMRERRL
jgi:hypothetical protein